MTEDSYMREEQVQALISRWLDGSLSVMEVKKLQEELKANEDARDDWLLLSRIHAELSDNGVEQELLNEINQTHVAFRSRHRRKAARRKFLSAAASLAACVLIGAWIATAFPSADEPEPQRVAVGDASDFVVHIDRVSDDCVWRVGHAETQARAFGVNDVLHVTSGRLAVRYAHGTQLFLESPAVFRFVTPLHGKIISGYIKAIVPEEAKGFTVATPQANVIDLGTEFGVSVNTNGTTDVIVYRGEVDIDYLSPDTKAQRLTMGEAVRLDEVGTASRLMSVRKDAYADGPHGQRSRTPIITEVRDNIERDPSMLSFYEIINEGMQEDALAYVDRIAHEYNGATRDGIPSQLLGGDYVKMFNRDKYESTIQIDVKISQPAKLYILLDERRAAPEWLKRSFTNTGEEIGLDVGPFQSVGPDWHNRGPSGVGPGESVDHRLKVWVCEVDEPGVVRLGPLSPEDEHGANMYGIVATPRD